MVVKRNSDNHTHLSERAMSLRTTNSCSFCIFLFNRKISLFDTFASSIRANREESFAYIVVDFCRYRLHKIRNTGLSVHTDTFPLSISFDY